VYTSSWQSQIQKCHNNQAGEENTYIDLDDLVHAGASSGQDSLDVIAANLCLGADVALDQVGGGVSGDLARDEDLTVGTDGLGL
jgi:hypothetical protein